MIASIKSMIDAESIDLIYELNYCSVSRCFSVEKIVVKKLELLVILYFSERFWHCRIF